MVALTFVGGFQLTIFQFGYTFENFFLETFQTIRKWFDVNGINGDTVWISNNFHFINRPHFDLIRNFSLFFKHAL